MKQIVSKLIFSTVIALAASVVTTQTAEARWSWHSGWQHGWSCNNDKGSSNKGSKGSHDKGSKGSSDKGSKCDKGSKGSHDKGSKGSSDKGSKGCHGSKGSKGSKHHHGSKGSSDKGSKGSKGSSCHVNATGKVCGLVFIDSDENGRFSRWDDERLANVTVIITDSNGDQHKVKTNKRGFYCAKHIPEGEATVEIDKNTLPSGVEQVVGDDPTSLYVRPHKRNWAGKDGYSKPVATGSVCGKVFEDANGNGVQDTGEAGIKGIKVHITDEAGTEFTVTTDQDGNYCQTGVVEGSAVIDVDDTSLPSGAVVTTEDPTTIDVQAGTDNQAGDDGIKLAPTGNVCGTVYVDVNKNGRKDYGEPGIANITVNITDSNGKVTSVETGVDGKYCASGIAEGTAVVDVDENDPDMPADSVQTLNEDPSTVDVVADTNNDAGIDGYYNPHTGLGCTCAHLYIDANADGKYTYADGDRGIKNITVTLVDSQGNTHTLETDAFGYMFAVLPLGETTLTVDMNDPDMPVGLQLLEGAGENPVTFENTAGQNSHHYGFIPKITP